MEYESNKRTYMQIGGGRLLDIQVYLDGNMVYDGILENAPDEIKKLKYSEIQMSNKLIYKVYSELQ